MFESNDIFTDPILPGVKEFSMEVCTNKAQRYFMKSSASMRSKSISKVFCHIDFLVEELDIWVLYMKLKDEKAIVLLFRQK